MASLSGYRHRFPGRVITLCTVLLLTACGETTHTAANDNATAVAPADAAAELLKKGRSRAAICASCHGSRGISVNPLYPSLAGKEAEILKEALQAYRSGTRVNPLMSPQARNLTDEDISLLSNYFAALPAPKTP